MENSGASISMAYSIRRESWVFLGHGLPLLKMSNIMQNHAVHGLGAKNGCLILINLNTWKTIQNYCSSHEQIFDPHNTTLAWHRYWHGTWSTSLVAFHQSTWTNIPERTHPIPSTILFVPPIESWIILWSSLIYAWIGVPCWGYSTGPAQSAAYMTSNLRPKNSAWLFACHTALAMFCGAEKKTAVRRR